jgi:uncharacterized protein
VNRDRDQSGRPRNARPRDELGRPLPRPPVAGCAAPQAGGVASSPVQSASLGGALLLDGRPFHAHEVFEEAWKGAEGPERDLWRGLAQVAVGLTHARRGNARGAVALLHRGAARLRDYGAAKAVQDSYGVDIGYVAARAAALAGQIDHDGLEALTANALLLGLRPGDGPRHHGAA